MNKMRNKSNSALVPALFLLALTGMFSSCSSSDGEEKAKSVSDAPKKDSVAAPTATFELAKGQLSADLFVPGELVAFQQVDLYAKVNSFVKKLYVDVGSEVREGELLATLEAPELQSQLASAESRVKSQEAIYIASKSNYDRIVETSKTPGTISQNDIDQADARQKSDLAQWDAAKAAYKEIAETLKYLEIRAPFGGVISIRNVNPGAIVGPSGKGSELPIFTLQQQDHLRLVISVPEALTGYLRDQQKVNFTVKSQPGRRFTATVKRLAGALDNRLRAERTEMDVFPKNKELLPGMVAEVDLAMPAKDSTFVVPVSAVVNSTERVFVIRVSDDHTAEWVDVQPGRTQGGKMEIYGSKLKEGDKIVTRASEELRNGSPVH
ncbi:MAG TPA: efflux RND transporter periplasmic adaptor subunit [Puia sp.]|uniref:efflux RND transporter periplasmic adaptor subunit n=1 Tax=Puia sp. TaxID=2045100 RepID=UPI002C515FBF|nr:efflux RND transporter periplasmic adaptor subunit [Puia sp.]HVU96999.1 efflux RND transporter periplasmic adaptor subunit [Puia sp.]